MRVTVQELTKRVIEDSTARCKKGEYKPGSFEEKVFIENNLAIAIKSLLGVHKLHSITPKVEVGFGVEGELKVRLDSYSQQVIDRLGIAR